MEDIGWVSTVAFWVAYCILQVDAGVLGKNVKTQYRKSGRQQKMKDKEPTAEDLKRREELEAKYSEWGKG
jgi:hypothetical protein